MEPYELIRQLMEKEGLGAFPLARKIGRPDLQPSIHRYASGQIKNPNRAMATLLANHFKIPIDAIYDRAAAISTARILGIHPSGAEPEEKEKDVKDKTVPKKVVNFSSQSDINVAPKRFELEGIEMQNVFGVFDVTVNDASMAPELPEGCVVRFDADLKPKFGQRVLIVDKWGQMHIRTMAQTRDEEWQGKVENPAFLTLSPGADGAKIVATKIGHYIESH